MKKALVRHHFRLDPDISRALAERARERAITKTEIVEAALQSLLTHDAEQRIEAVLARRLDRISRQLDRLEWHGELGNETMSLFIRSWLTNNPPLPDTAMKAAQASGKMRWSAFVETLARRMNIGPKLHEEVDQSAANSDPK